MPRMGGFAADDGPLTTDDKADNDEALVVGRRSSVVEPANCVRSSTWSMPGTYSSITTWKLVPPKP